MAKKPYDQTAEVETDPVEVTEDTVDASEAVEAPVAPVESPKPSEGRTASSVIARDGDSYVSIAERIASGKGARALAGEIMALNGGAPVRAGKKIFLPKGK